jgi:hypothetical protein
MCHLPHARCARHVGPQKRRGRKDGAMVAEPKVRVAWSPRGNPAQMRLLKCQVFEIFFGGARGGGKTDGVLGEFVRRSCQPLWQGCHRPDGAPSRRAGGNHRTVAGRSARGANTGHCSSAHCAGLLPGVQITVGSAVASSGSARISAAIHPRPVQVELRATPSSFDPSNRMSRQRSTNRRCFASVFHPFDRAKLRNTCLAAADDETKPSALVLRPLSLCRPIAGRTHRPYERCHRAPSFPPS